MYAEQQKHDSRESLEDRVKALVGRSSVGEAADAVIRSLAPEVLGYLSTVSGDRSLADEAFSIYCERVWRGLGRFEFRSSLRTWSYVIARRSLQRAIRNRTRQRRGEIQLATGEWNAMAKPIASTMGTRNHALVTQIRRELDEYELSLLVLRLDRNMSWTDVARVLHPDEPADRVSARVRKRFERTRRRIRKMTDPVEVTGGDSLPTEKSDVRRE